MSLILALLSALGMTDMMNGDGGGFPPPKP